MEKCIKTKINEQVIINKPIKEFYIKSKEDIIDHVTDVFIYTKYKIYSIPLYYYIPELYFGKYNEENELKMKNKIITYKISLKNTYYIYAIKIYQSKKEIKDNEILIEYDEEKLGEFNDNESIKRDGINFTLLEELEDDCDIVLNNKSRYIDVYNWFNGLNINDYREDILNIAKKCNNENMTREAILIENLLDDAKIINESHQEIQLEETDITNTSMINIIEEYEHA
jgi:hypothetical protein